MLEAEFEMLKLLSGNSSASQRFISKTIGVSLGKVNSLIKQLSEDGYLKKDISENGTFYRVTEAGIKLLEHNINKVKMLRLNIHENTDVRVKQAVILAAGKRKEVNSPTSLLEIDDFILIERTIKMLIKNEITRIIIITGYKNELFKGLEEKYKEVELVVSEDYICTGTMNSLSVAKEVINDDFILIESDLIFEEKAIVELKNSEERDCILLTHQSGSGDEAFVELRDGYLFKIAKDIHQLNNIHGEVVGITKISYKLFLLMLEEYSKNTNPYINYEYTLLDVARNYNVGFIRIHDLIWGEIDTLEQYDIVKNIIYPKIKEKESINCNNKLN